MDKIKIKLVAIAKNEAAYLPQWIFHHLRLGVDSIDIYINGSSDNSVEISRIINSFEPRFKFYESDKYVEKCIKEGKKFQKIFTIEPQEMQKQRLFFPSSFLI